MNAGFQFALLHLTLMLTQLHEGHFDVRSHVGNLREDAADVIHERPTARAQLDKLD